MAEYDDELPLGGFLNGRIIPDAQDLVAIRTRIAALEAQQATLTKSSLRRIVNESAINRNKDELSLLGTAEIVAREHVRASPQQSRNLELFERQKRDAAMQELVAEQSHMMPLVDDRPVENSEPPPPPPSPGRGFDRKAWQAKRRAGRNRGRPGLADDD